MASFLCSFDDRRASSSGNAINWICSALISSSLN
ncbi:hypothetical protein LINPERHAP1_LOCUS16098 [Linum perenne]